MVEQGDCTSWTSLLKELTWTAGNTYYIVIDGYGYSEGDYILEFDVFSPLVGYTIYQDGLPVGSSDDNEWSTTFIYWFDN